MDHLARIADAIERLADAKSPDDLLSVGDVAAMLHVSEDRVRASIRNHTLNAYDLNKGGPRPHYVIKRVAVYEYLDATYQLEKPQRAKAKKKLDAGDWV